MRYYLVILILIVVLALFLGSGFFGERNSSVVITSQNLKTEEFEEQSIIKEVNPISLLALMEKDFDGRDLKLGQIQDDNNLYTRYHVTYKSGELAISGILNIPKGIPPEGGWPVLFLNHGHIDVSVYTNGRGLRREQDYLARQGFAVLHSDYRNHAQSDKDPDTEGNIRIGYIEDVINAVEAVKNSNIASLSKEKFGMLGHSMGGGISQAVMVVKPDLVGAVVLYAPVSSDVVDSYNRWTSRRSDTATEISQKHGTPDQNPEFWKNMSPKTFFEKVESPVIIFHGTADDSCDIEWSRETRDLLLSLGKKVELVEYTNEAHEFGPAHTDFMIRTAEFFKTHL